MMAAYHIKWPQKGSIHTMGSLKEELERLQSQQIKALLGMDKTSKWCSFVQVLNGNGGVRLCLHPARFSNALTGPVHRGPKLNDILPKLSHVKYLMLIDASFGYHKLRIDEKSSYLTTFSCPFGRYQYTRISFRAAPVRDMF